MELGLALSVVGTLATGVVKTAANQADRARVVAAQGAVLDAYRQGQAAAAAFGRPAEVLICADSIVVRSIGMADTIVVRRLVGPESSGVAISPRSHSTRFGPTGLAIGAANVTHTLTRGSVTRQVVVSRLGRIRTT
jgi:type II secretory pathway pseudopilin PulG